MWSRRRLDETYIMNEDQMSALLDYIEAQTTEMIQPGSSYDAVHTSEMRKNLRVSFGLPEYKED